MTDWMAMSGLALVANAAKVLVTKRMASHIDAWLLVLAARIASAVVLLPVAIYLGAAFPVAPAFWITVATTTVLTAIASTALTTAIQRGRLGVVMPIQASIPLFVAIVLAATYREWPRPLGLASIAAVTIGIALVLSDRPPRTAAVADSAAALDVNVAASMPAAAASAAAPPANNWYYPLLSLLAAALFGMCTVLDRVAIAAVDQGAIVYSAYWNLTSSLFMLPGCRRHAVAAAWQSPSHRLAIAAFALAGILAFITQQVAVQWSLAVTAGVLYVKLIVMLHLPLVVAIGVLCFREPISLRASIGALVTISGGVGLLLSMG